MDGRKLLNLSLQTLFFLRFLRFFFFILLYIKDTQLDKKKEGKWFFVCYILDIYFLLNSIIYSNFFHDMSANTIVSVPSFLRGFDLKMEIKATFLRDNQF